MELKKEPQSILQVHLNYNLGFNSQEWFISFFGALFAGLMPVGVYTTNNMEACEYVAENSDCSLVIAEDNI